MAGHESLTGSGTSTQAEIDALLNQIRATSYSTEQIEAIDAMQLTRIDFQTTLSELGISLGAGRRAAGAGRNISDAEKAAREATRTASGRHANERPGNGGVLAIVCFLTI